MDSYMNTPTQGLDVMYSEFRGSAINQLPILRLFGSTATGQKICLHIHGVFPYFYIPYDGNEEVNSLMYRIAAGIDKAINISFNQANSNTQHVYKICLVSGIPMYGYHNRKHQFFKVHLYNPVLIRRVGNLLMNDSMLGKIYQPHETHIPFILQFMIDYNLHGMSNLVLSEMKFRVDPLNENPDLSPELILSTVKKVSVCELEGDAFAEHILNRLEVASGNVGVNPGIAALWADEMQRRRNKGESSQIQHLLEMKNVRVKPTKSHSAFKQALSERLAVASTDKDVVDEKLNLSVYPAETPENVDIQSASLVDSQIPSSLELTLDDTLTSVELNSTLVSGSLSETLDEEGLNMLQILQNLVANVNENVEEDSILSQVVKESDDDKELDLSVPLQAVMTPKKIIPNDEDSVDNDDLWNTTLVPQLDGECDDDEEYYNELMSSDTHDRRITRSFLNSLMNKRQIKNEISEQQKFIKKALYVRLIRKEFVKKGRNMPLLDDDFDFADHNNFPPFASNIVNKSEECKVENTAVNSNSIKKPLEVIKHETVKTEKTTKVKGMKKCKCKNKETVSGAKSMEKQLRSWKFHIKRYKRKNQIIKMMRKIHAKEHKICILLSKDCKPSFKVIPGHRIYFPPYATKSKADDKIDIISEIMLQTNNHIDPDLHLTLQYPSKNTFLYVYNENVYPQVTKVPKKFTKPGNETILKTFINSRTAKISDDNNNRTNFKPSNSTDDKKLNTGCLRDDIKKFRNVQRNIDKEKPVEEIQTGEEIPREEQVLFSQEIIDSDNEKGCYIFSHKYLNKVNDNNLIRKIRNQSVNQIKETLEHIKNELERHIACLEETIRNRRKPAKHEVNENDDNFTENSQSTDNLDVIKPDKDMKREREVNNNKKCAIKDINDTAEYEDQYEATDYGKDVNFCSEFKNFYVKPEATSGSDDSWINEDKVKKHLCLDGAMDSSSSEDEPDTLRRKRSLKRESVVNFSRYSALPVTIQSSPSVKSQGASSNKHLVSQSANKNFKEKETPVKKVSISQSVCDINFKRKLNFSNASLLQTTVIEEKLVCNYSPSSREKLSELISDKVIKGDVSKFECEDISIEHKSPDKDCNSSDASRGEFFLNSDSEDGGNNSFFRSPQIANKLNLMLTTAQKYDLETNYKAKEGSSKALTPQSLVNSQNELEEILHSSGSSSFGVLTPYQRVVEEPGRLTNIFEDQQPEEKISSKVLDGTLSRTNSLPHVITETNCDTTVLIPVKIAPTRDQVIKSLDKYRIPLVKRDAPFYSDIEDVTGSVEVGYNVLRVTSKASTHLPEFESQTDSINNYRKIKMKSMSSNLEWKRSSVNNVALSFCKDRECILEPIKKTPSVKAVKDWIKEKSKGTAVPKKKPEKVKIFIPLSPGNEDEDMDMSLTLSPCTPTSQCNSNPSQTPKSSSPILGQECRRRKKEARRKLSQSITTSLRKSLLLSQDKSSITNTCQITGVSPNISDKSIENLQAARAVIEHQNLTLLVMELHFRTRGEFKPNPEYDSICSIFYSVLNDVPNDHHKAQKCKGVIAINALPVSPGTSSVPLLDGAGVNCDITYVDSEENLLSEFLKVVAYWDPDILAGYEIQMLSWGYLIERASVLGVNLKSLLSRTKEEKRIRDEEGQDELQIVGRIVLDVWRLMRHEVALQSYTFESVCYHILHKRVPQYSFKDLSFWWDHRSNLYRHRAVNYYLFRVETILELFDKLDVIGRTSELARLFGIQFFEVLSRGSQFRVESMMMRLAKPLNFVPVSPSVQQRAFMKAPEYIPLVLEPESKLYNDPVIVLDFQSLYPSMIIAYNYCFTTCVGRVECLGKNTPFEFGVSQLKIARRRLEKLLKKDLLNFSPCGIGFVKRNVRDGILPKMLREILDTRLMVKNSMKENKEDRLLQKVLHNRQLGLKLIANVTYGYTAANFSGRMPSVEIGDSVVSKGRETLQRAIELVDNTPEWGARVVYGDTDSLFVLVPGKTKRHAFEIGKKIADAVTKANPHPVKLKLEKVYQPCILQTKKRYVGYMYESPDQKEPVYEAKGIETVRRDGCPAVSKMLEKCLRLLFETKDVSLIKKYVLRQFHKIIAGRASIQDLTFAKEYRGASGYRPGACVPSLELARKWTAIDKRNEPRRGERVPYIIINGPPGLPLIRLVRSPRDLLSDPSLRPNALYYITKAIIPAINRCFNLIGVDLNAWFNQMPRKQIQALPSSVSPGTGKKSTISQYFSTSSCVSCGEQTQTGICNACMGKPQTTCVTLMEKLRKWERNDYTCNLICQTCTSTQTEIKCVSLDCPVLYRRIQTSRDAQQATYIRELISSNDFLF